MTDADQRAIQQQNISRATHRLLSKTTDPTGEAYLVILHSQIFTLPALLVRHLHEKPTYERLPNIFVMPPLVLVLH